MLPLSSQGGAKLKWSESKVMALRVAQMEHDRWVEERRIKQPGQPDHPDLCLWKDLPKKEKDKDIRSVGAIPDNSPPDGKRSRKEKTRGAAA